MMRYIRCGIFNALFFPGIALWMCVCFPFLWMHPKYARWMFKQVGNMTLSWCRFFLDIEYEVRGQQHIPKDGKVIFASKHQSVWETGAYLTLLPYYAAPFKIELMKVPLYGRFLEKAGMIPIDRSKGAKAMRHMIEKAKEAVEEDLDIAIFPEGTRVAPGAPTEYHRGILFLYEKLNLPVVPIALNSGVYWPRHEFLKKPGTIVMEYLKPIPEGLKRDEFMKTLEDRIETASNKLLPKGYKTDD